MIILSLLLAMKHLLGDGILRNQYMNAGKQRDEGWMRPLLLHAVIHGVLTTIAIYLYLTFITANWQYPLLVAAICGFVDMVTHTIIDRWKEITRKREIISTFWLNVIDQALHTFVYMIMIVILTTY